MLLPTLFDLRYIQLALQHACGLTEVEDDAPTATSDRTCKPQTGVYNLLADVIDFDGEVNFNVDTITEDDLFVFKTRLDVLACFDECDATPECVAIVAWRGGGSDKCMGLGTDALQDRYVRFGRCGLSSCGSMVNVLRVDDDDIDIVVTTTTVETTTTTTTMITRNNHHDHRD